MIWFVSLSVDWYCTISEVMIVLASVSVHPVNNEAFLPKCFSSDVVIFKDKGFF